MPPRNLLPLLACVLVVMMGVGIALPVMPLFVERLVLRADTAGSDVARHIGLLTAAFPLVQLFVAPIWGRLSDRIGRRPLVIIGVLGFAVTQALFGLATGLPTLYAARIGGGVLSAALLPAATAYVSDATSEVERARGIAWLNTAVGLGTVIGPGLGALLVRTDIHLRGSLGHLVFDGFSVPFFVAALLAVAALVAAIAIVQEPPRVPRRASRRHARAAVPILAATTAAYLGITVFETVFALFARWRFRFGATEIAAAFTVCGGIMIVAQLAGASLVRRVGERRVAAGGLGLMGGGLFVLVISPGLSLVIGAVTLLGVGMAFVGPSLSALVTLRAPGQLGAALGAQTAAQSAGQVAGPLLGTFLFGWNAQAPYVVAGLVMLAAAVFLIGPLTAGVAVPPSPDTEQSHRDR